jgi:hypothetical protein
VNAEGTNIVLWVAYVRGWNARQMQWSQQENPYEASSWEHASWVAGWEDFAS